MARAEQQGYFIAAAAIGSMVPVPGAVPVRGSDGVLFGAVGITGDTSENDERVAIAGIVAVGLTTQPD
jgi:uncharacterized protein GlcG (DUF336 family)